MIDWSRLGTAPEAAYALARKTAIEHFVFIYRVDKEYSRYAVREYVKRMNDRDIIQDVKDRLHQEGLL